MITFPDLEREVHEMLKGPMTKETVEMLSNMVYLMRHFPEESQRDGLDKWPYKMMNEDGTVGAHWTMAETNQVMSRYGIECDPVKFWIVMNMIYSDEALIAAKYGVNNVAYYADRAKAWLHDKDAVPDKLEQYYRHIAK